MQKLQLSIPEPCHENWDNMTPEGQGRFCGSCAKQVIDFSAMTDNQLMQYFANLKNENVCGRVHPDQLNHAFVMPDPARKKIWMYWQYVLAVLLFFFTKNQLAKAQTGLPKTELQPAKPVDANREGRIMLGGIRRASPDEMKTITIQDETGGVIPFATGEITSSGAQLMADSSGKINVSGFQAQDSIKLSAVGYHSQTFSLKDINGKIVRLATHITSMEEITLHGNGTTKGKMIMAGGISYTRVGKVHRLKDTLQNLISFLDSDIGVFPNPVKKGNAITLAVKLKKPGTYQIVFSDVSGRQLLQQIMQATTKQVQQQVTLPVSWASGLYFVKILDEKSIAVRTGKFMVE